MDLPTFGSGSGTFRIKIFNLGVINSCLWTAGNGKVPEKDWGPSILSSEEYNAFAAQSGLTQEPPAFHPLSPPTQFLSQAVSLQTKRVVLILPIHMLKVHNRVVKYSFPQDVLKYQIFGFNTYKFSKITEIKIT